MNSESEKDDRNFNVIEELTAYLDGELDEAAITKVETRLNQDPEYLAEMQSLQKTWDILDSLPQTEASPTFTKTTMELVVSEVLKDAKAKRRWNLAWLGRAAILLALPLALFATAYGLTRNSQAEPDRLLIENLTAIENHYRYPSVMVGDDIQFLQQLKSKNLFVRSQNFDGDNIDFTPVANTPPSTKEEREQYIKLLDVEQKIKLQEQLEAFRALSKSDKDKRIEFDEKLYAHEENADLVQVLKLYTDWLENDLDSAQKSRLLDEIEIADSIDAKIAAISGLRYQQSRDVFGRTGAQKLPSPDDRQTVYLWYENVIETKQKQIRKRLPSAVAKTEKRPGRKNASNKKIVERWAEHGPLPNIVSYLMKNDRDFLIDVLLDEQDMEALYNLLTLQAQDELDSLSISQQQSLILQWIDSANQSRLKLSTDLLAKFENQLSEKERDELDKMSIENYRKTLEEKFRNRMRPRRNEFFDWEDYQDLEDFLN